MVNLGFIFIVFFLIIIVSILFPVFFGRHVFVRWIGGSYVVILLLSAVLFYLLPVKGLDNPNVGHSSETDIESFTNTLEEFEQAATEGRLDQVKGVEKKGEWDWAYDEPLLNVSRRSEVGWPIYVERKEVDDGHIEVAYYATGTFVGVGEREGVHWTVDLTEEVPSPEVKLQGNWLMLRQPEPLKVMLVRLDQEFTVTQFKEKGELGNANAMHHLSAHAFTLRIPKNLEISSHGTPIQYVEDAYDD